MATIRRINPSTLILGVGLLDYLESELHHIVGTGDDVFLGVGRLVVAAAEVDGAACGEDDEDEGQDAGEDDEEPDIERVNFTRPHPDHCG